MSSFDHRDRKVDIVIDLHDREVIKEVSVVTSQMFGDSSQGEPS